MSALKERVNQAAQRYPLGEDERGNKTCHDRRHHTNDGTNRSGVDLVIRKSLVLTVILQLVDRCSDYRNGSNIEHPIGTRKPSRQNNVIHWEQMNTATQLATAAVTMPMLAPITAESIT